MMEPGPSRRGTIAALLVLGLLASVAFPAPAPGQAVGDTPLAGEAERAIEAGATYLRRSVARDGLGAISRGYPLGSRALVAYALLESGIDHDDPLVVRLFEEMAEQEFRQVYGVSLYSLALHAWSEHAPPVVERRRGAPEVTAEVLPGGRRVREEIARCAEWLVAVRVPGAGTWGYGAIPRDTRDPWSDFSNTQFAALALHVAVHHGLAVPRGVFEEMVGTFSRSAYAGSDEIEITVDRTPWLGDDDDDEPVGRTGVVRTLRGRPISWGYRPIDPRRRRPGAAGWGTTSMTAAAVSSLVVAEHGLAAHRVRNRRLSSALDLLVTGGVIELSRAWHPTRERVPGSMHRNLYYTLYSFEKAMDLAGVGVLDGTDWYRAQVPFLLQDQGRDGGWGAVHGGGDGGEYRRMATCFTLLFLRRATASLTVHAAAPIITHGGEAPAGISSGQVLLPSLGGAVSLDELFDKLARDRSRELLDLAAEAVAAVAPEERPELLRWLLPLAQGTSRSDRVGRFARESIAAITGLPERTDRAALGRWLERWRWLRSVSAGGRTPGATGEGVPVGEIGALAADPSLGVPLRRDAIVALRRSGSLNAVPGLLDLLEDESVEVRGLAHGALRDLTRADLPFEREGSAATRGEQGAAWRFWWSANGDDLRIARRFDALRARLERAEGPEERAGLREELIAMGTAIVPRIERILAGGSYAFDWLLVRQGITDEAGVPAAGRP